MVVIQFLPFKDLSLKLFKSEKSFSAAVPANQKFLDRSINRILITDTVGGVMTPLYQLT